MQIVDYNETRLVKRHRGTMPIILTSPHGGSEIPPGVPRRDPAKAPADCTGGKAVNNSSDGKTNEITEAVARKIFELTGLTPYVVIAKFLRERIDANRPARCAFFDEDARPFYEEYHNRIDGYIEQIRAQNENRGFLFDIHGTGRDTHDILLGTGNGTTFMPGFDSANLFMRHGLHGLLSAVRLQILPMPSFGYRIDPPDPTTNEILNGGFTVRNYSPRLNCVQIEISTGIQDFDLRRNLLVEDLAFAMINFVRRYAPF